jgi:hypothetical protein
MFIIVISFVLNIGGSSKFTDLNRVRMLETDTINLLQVDESTGANPRLDFLAVKIEKMTHDEFDGGFVDMIVFPALGEIGQPAKRLVDGGHLKGRKIVYIFMPSSEFVGGGAQGRFGVAAGADDIQVIAKGRPQVHR